MFRLLNVFVIDLLFPISKFSVSSFVNLLSTNLEDEVIPVKGRDGQVLEMAKIRVFSDPILCFNVNRYPSCYLTTVPFRFHMSLLR